MRQNCESCLSVLTPAVLYSFQSNARSLPCYTAQDEHFVEPERMEPPHLCEKDWVLEGGQGCMSSYVEFVHLSLSGCGTDLRLSVSKNISIYQEILKRIYTDYYKSWRILKNFEGYEKMSLNLWMAMFGLAILGTKSVSCVFHLVSPRFSDLSGTCSLKK